MLNERVRFKRRSSDAAPSQRAARSKLNFERHHFRHLTDLPALENISLNATPITDAGLKHLAQIKTLKSRRLVPSTFWP